MIGTLGNTVFGASSRRVYTPSGTGRSGGPRIEDHAIIGRKAIPEFVAPANETISYMLRLDASYGVNPSAEIDRLRASRDTGEILPLVWAGKYLGDWLIADLSETWKATDGRGRVLVAEVSVQLKEVPSA